MIWHVTCRVMFTNPAGAILSTLMSMDGVEGATAQGQSPVSDVSMYVRAETEGEAVTLARQHVVDAIAETGVTGKLLGASYATLAGPEAGDRHDSRRS